MTPTSEGPFSHPARIALIDEFFDGRVVAAETAWQDVYRLLLWVDSTTGLAHCYESDKSQPGRPWYARSLAFHAWLAEQLGVSSISLVDELDWMFRQVIKNVAAEEADKRAILAERAGEQLDAYKQGMPVPGDDPELRQIIEPLLVDPGLPTDQTVRDVLRQVRAHIASENKRKNLLGRGFEDVLATIIDRLDTGRPPGLGTQTAIEDIRGFRSPRSGDKTEKVDLWVEPEDGPRILASAKWSVRADREKQMRGDFLTYVSCNELREPFEYMWITNEFDPARLVANATNTEGNQHLLSAVVHICPEALRVVHELDRSGLRETPARLKELLADGRIIGLDEWLAGLSPTP